ncbi:MAG TPA: MFS transporter [Acidimicrobiia bacterium]|nr:MFS transporter [Acidimicrobiia bacterium]
MPAHWKRNVALFLTGQTVSLFGSMVVQYVVMWYVTLETRSGTAVALYAVAAFLPQGVVSIFAGVLADRMNRKKLIIVADAGIALVTLGLALLMMSGVDDLWILLLAVAVRSVGAGVQTPTVQAIIPQISPANQLMRVNGIFQSIGSAMALVAPAVAAGVYAVFGLVPVFFLDVVTAVIGIGLLATVAVPTLARAADNVTSFREDLVEGMRYIWTHRIVRWLLVVFAIIFLLIVPPSFVTPLLVVRNFGTEEWMLAALEISFSVGMVLGGIVVATWLTKRSRMGLILFSTYSFAVLSVAMGLSNNLWVFYGLMFLFGLGVPLFSTPFMTLIQETVEPEKHGRVFSYVGIVMALATPIGMAVFGPLADVIRVESLLIVGGLIMIGVMTLAVFMPSGRRAIEAARTPHAEVEPAEAAAG